MFRGDWNAAGTRLVQAAVDLTGSLYGFLQIRGETRIGSAAYQNIVVTSDRQPLLSGSDDGVPLHPDLEGPANLGLESAATVLTEVPMGSFLGTLILHADVAVAVLEVAGPEQTYWDLEREELEVLSRTGSGILDNFRQQQRQASLEEQLQQARKMEALVFSLAASPTTSTTCLPPS